VKLSAWLQLQRGIKTLYAHPLIAATPLWRKLNPQARYVAITGSAGKTTTKDLLVTALGGGPHAIGNDNSNNQPYGTARTMLRVRPWTRIVVQEFGASEPGGIARMARQFSHGVAVVLNVGNDHRSAFGGEDGIALEKGVLVETLPADGLALLNADDARVMAMASRTKARVITFGLASGDVRGRLIAAPWPSGVVVEVTAGNESVVIRTGLIAEHFALNVVAAVATAWALGTKLQDIVPRLADSTTLLVIPANTSWYTIGPLDARAHRRSLRRTGTVEPIVVTHGEVMKDVRPDRFTYLALPNANLPRALVNLGVYYDWGPPRRFEHSQARANRPALTAWRGPGRRLGRGGRPSGGLPHG